MNWFKSLWLTSEERKILKEAKEKKLQPIVSPTATVHHEEIVDVRPYKKLIYSAKNLTVVFHTGDIITVSNIERDMFEKVKDSKSDADIRFFLLGAPPTPTAGEESAKDIELVKENNSVFNTSDDFEVIKDDVYMKGIRLPLPTAVSFSFIELLEKMELEEDVNNIIKLEDQYNALKMFWLKLALNPIQSSREDLINFVRKNDVRITQNGNLVMYRRIEKIDSEKDTTLTSFISQAYYDRKKQKKSQTHPRNYNVIRDDGNALSIIKITENMEGAEVLGNLESMYKNLSSLEENTFTSHYNRGKLQIKVGSVYKIPDDEINLDNGNCAAGGLHAAAVNYDYSGFGDTPVVVLVNPSKAITVPVNETGKMRTTEMFIACVNNKPIGKHFDEDALAAFDEEYHDFTLSELEESVKNKSFDNISIKNNKPIVNMVDLEKIKEMLNERIQTV